MVDQQQKIYFVSDVHLGIPNAEKSLIRERKLVEWLEHVCKDASEIYLLGDIFDFWFEYKTVVPKGYVRLLGKIAEITDSGIPVHFFTGNHDLWVFSYFEKELGVIMHTKPQERIINGKLFFIAHGDGLGPKDTGYKILKRVLINPLSIKLFSFLHPGFGMSLALYFSRKSRMANERKDEVFLGEQKEWHILFCKQKIKEKNFDYFILGHRHLPMEHPIGEKAKYINTGDWIYNFSYAVTEGAEVLLKKWS
ncbi:MAG: UDP-2,3-diacylglucosamine diphosphatase [Bacteroidota bacterium]